MLSQEIRKRTKKIALDIISLIPKLPRSLSVDIISRQLIRCGTSPGANYRAACRAKSRADFIAKMKIVEEELDEILYWLDLLMETQVVSQMQIATLLDQVNQTLSITVACLKTTRQNPIS